MDTRAWFGGVLFSLAPCATLAHAMTQGEPSATEHVTLEGFVLAPDGSPAEGAMVTSSAGGQAVTDVAGFYRLAVQVPREATGLEVSAVGSAGGVASARVALSASTPTTRGNPLVLSLLASCSPCSPRWVPTFGEQAGVDGSVLDFATFDDGHGPALYVAGAFLTAGGVPAKRIARWDGSRWTALGSGMSGGSYPEVRALAVYDNGRGPALYAGGSFTTAGGGPANHIARWDGSSWTALGGGSNDEVRALAVYDDGGGPALYAGGSFTTAGGVPASHVAKWNGSSWAALGSGMGGTYASVDALTVFDDGRGAALYAGGAFTTAGGGPASCIAKWNGSSWAALGGGVDSAVYALAVYDDGGGPALFAAGSFLFAGGAPARKIARWNGSGWTAVGGGFHDGEDDVFALVVYDDGGGPDLCAGGNFFSVGGVSAFDIARWNGSSWAALGSGMQDDHGGVGALAVYDDGRGPALYAGGGFTIAGGVGASGIARWDGSRWAAPGSGLSGDVRALAKYDDGGGPALFAGGYYFATATARGGSANWIAKWDGSSWAALGGGVDNIVNALAEHDDGRGPALYVGGAFTTAGGVAVNGIARWDGSRWTALGGGVRGTYASVAALAVYDDGRGPALYAGGTFTSAGGVAVDNIARWDGSSWSPLGSGVGGNFSSVAALAVFDDGGGPALYAGGNFTSAGGFAANGVARWDGSSWSALGSGVETYPGVAALAVFDDGRGPALYAGGDFTIAGGARVTGIARWDGSRWSALGSGVSGGVHALLVHDDGSGPALYAGGSFTTAGGVAANRIARWNGSAWSALGGGMTGYALDFIPDVLALAALADAGGPALFAGGTFASAIDSGDSFLARWSCPKDVLAPALSCPSSVLVLDALGSPPGEVVSFSVTASDCRDPAPVVMCVPPSGSFFPRGTTLVTCTATDASGNQSTCQFPVTVRLKAR
jgi:hypothetical protein